MADIEQGVPTNRLTPISKVRGGWLCLCVCGTETTVRAFRLKSGHTKSCGCLQKEAVKRTGEQNRTHGGTDSSEFLAWRNARVRCEDLTNPNYGGRGIKFCERWQGATGFANFIADMGRKPSPELTLERKNTNGNYEPGNCYWATQKQQQRNRRNTKSITYRGVTRLLVEWAEDLDIPPSALWVRVFSLKWDIEKAFTQPVGKRTPRKIVI